jgi:hypothetical protein
LHTFPTTSRLEQRSIRALDPTSLHARKLLHRRTRRAGLWVGAAPLCDRNVLQSANLRDWRQMCL